MILVYDFDGNDFEYEIDTEDLKKAIVNIVLNRNNITTITSMEHKLLLIMAEELDVVWNEKILDEFQDEINDYFYEDAYIRYQQQTRDSEDAETWYGTKNDIIGV